MTTLVIGGAGYIGSHVVRLLLERGQHVIVVDDLSTGDTERNPGAQYADEASLLKEIPLRATTVYHPVGSCKMGVDDLAVVSPSLAVHGVSGLRVIDASIMPRITTGNTNAPAILIGELGAKFVLAGER